MTRAERKLRLNRIKRLHRLRLEAKQDAEPMIEADQLAEKILP